jgi:hypothetical protein
LDGINYATSAWWTKERAEELKARSLQRDDVEEVFIEELSIGDAPQNAMEQNRHIAQHPQAENAAAQMVLEL